MSDNELLPGEENRPDNDIDAAFTAVLGYLNFSGGAADSTFLRQLDLLASQTDFADSWQPLRELLTKKLNELKGSSPTFSDIGQARSVIDLVFDSLLPAYIYHVLKDYLPEPALYMMRFHSFYAWHREGEYDWLCDDHDREMLPWVRKFNPYDLYSKSPSPPNWTELRPYYEALIAKYLPSELQF